MKHRPYLRLISAVPRKVQQELAQDEDRDWMYETPYKRRATACKGAVKNPDTLVVSQSYFAVSVKDRVASDR